MTTKWLVPMESILLTKESNEIVTLCVGDFITYTGRPDVVRIDEFTGRATDEGPMGMTYRPWRKESKKFAEILWSLKGNVRHIIAYPCGMSHYGEQIDWNSIAHLAPPSDASQAPQSLSTNCT